MNAHGKRGRGAPGLANRGPVGGNIAAQGNPIRTARAMTQYETVRGWGQALLLFATLSALIGVATVAHGSEPDHEAARALREAGEILPLEKVLDTAFAQHTGQVLEIELEQEDGRFVYEVEILDDAGVVWKMFLDARTGEMLETEEYDD